MKTYTIDTFDYSVFSKAGIQKRKKGNQGRRNNERKYKNLFCAFDIESTNDLSMEQAYMYIWQFQIEKYTIIGRTWDEYVIFLQRIAKLLDDDVYIMIYVHNLSYEFAFLKGIYSFQPEEVFAIQSRKILKCEMFEHFEYRCSYLLTNMGLASFTKKMGVPEKLSGEEFDYYKIRYPWTELSDRELLYCITDVSSLVEALKVYFSIENDTFYTIPLTSTGFVRRDVKSAMRHYNKQDLQNQLPDYGVFKIMREAFRGGNTHANRYYTEQIVKNVSSYDRVSSYPDVQINEKFPMGSWIYEPLADMERVLRKIYKQKRACLLRVGFHNIRLKDPMFGCPYIPKHKCRDLRECDNDNGRILYAKYLEISLTDIDFKIILDEYKFDEVIIFDFYHTRYGKLPKPMRDMVKKYFQDKTELKNVKGSELFYMLQKAKLNSIYGMCVQSPVKRDIKYINDEFIEDFSVPEQELLDKTQKRAFLNYAWGVWTTAHARYQLEIAVKAVGNNFVYCDTDSVKFIDDGTVNFDEYNKHRIEDSESNGGVATDRDGNKYYLGLYEFEGTYDKFVTLGAKKYANVKNGKLEITVAGVGKSKGASELDHNGGIEAFKEGFIFNEAGGTESVYNDDPLERFVQVDGHELEITSNVLIKQSTYTLGITGEYRRILNNPAIWLDLFK